MFEGALKRAIAQDDGSRLRAAAETLLTKAADGEPWALQMLADRLDGKASQSVEVKTTRSVEDCSLEELRDRVATLLAGAGPSPSGADESRPVH
jgi:hypothetical protein